jgi:hypothetical protein
MAATKFLRSGEIISHEQAAIELAIDEFLIGVQGRAGAYVDEIELATNKRGHPFSLLLPRDSSLKIRGFFGRSGGTLDPIGVIVE